MEGSSARGTLEALGRGGRWPAPRDSQGDGGPAFPAERPAPGRGGRAGPGRERPGGDDVPRSGGVAGGGRESDGGARLGETFREWGIPTAVALVVAGAAGVP